MVAMTTYQSEISYLFFNPSESTAFHWTNTKFHPNPSVWCY